ncbi:MAG TPA: MSMEG_0567/Sll0786 family nitrogen starvation N-acetyltransferase [Kribbellaceae bacterium]|nr:MSMEG_0567/Sll0786 family nitrogen starvation N-acetyltransferase [Kribbellaceae bacterium]
MRSGLVLETRIAVAVSDADLTAHHRIRQAVFVDEQRIFAGSDVDAHDSGGEALRVLARYDGVPAGTVRLYPLDNRGTWQGDRLAVLPRFRAHNVGGPLVRYAVATAGSLGGSVMVAHIQPPNVRFFERLGWSRDGEPETYCGLPHQPMRIALST